MSSDPQLDAGGIVQRQFTTARRGYDADEVRAYLQQLATQVGTLQRSEAELRDRAENAESRARKAEQLDEHRLVEILGEETARVLDAARAASTDIRGKAEESASRLISEANHEAHRVRAESEAALAAQRSELLAEVETLRADAAGELDRCRAGGAEIVAQMRREAQAECDSLRQQGEQKRLEAEMQAETIRAKAREEGRALVAEAQVVRERVLGDLARRRRSAREQLERLNAARERLLAAYEVVRRTVDEATSELTVVLPEAKMAGDSAVRRVQGEPQPSVEQLEDMVAMARITGLLEDAASQGFDEEDYLADDAPPPGVAGAELPAAAGEPVELYDVEAEDEDDLVVDGDQADAEVEPGIDRDLGFDLDIAVTDTVAVHDGEDDVVDDAVPAGIADPPTGPAVDEDTVEGDDEGPDDVVEVETGLVAGDPVDPAGAEGADVPVNGHPRPFVAGVTAAAPVVVPETAGAGAVPEPAVAVAAMALASGPPAVEADVADEIDLDEIGLAPSADLGIVDDRRVNGHPHPSVEVEEDEGDDEGDAGYEEDDEDLGEDEWFDDEVDDLGATSSVDELFARLRAGRDAPASSVPDGEHDDGHDARDTHGAAALADDLDHHAHVHDDDYDLVPAGGPGGRRRASSLVEMSDADILASAGYGDAGDDGYGSADGDDLTGGGDDIYGLSISEPEPTLVGGSDDEGDDDAGLTDMDPDVAMLRLRDDSLETVEHDLSRRLKRVLADEQNEILDTLRRHKPGNLDDLMPEGREAHVARYAEAAREGLSTAAAWGAASVEGEPAGSYEVLAGELGRTVVEPLRERIARSFTEAAGDVDDVTGRLRALYREWKGHHLAAAAQHYAVAAYARGAYEAVPDGTPVRWLVDRGTDPCPDADDNALAGPVCKGEAFPTGDRCPPAHPGCRCMVVPLDWPQLG